MPHIAGLCRTSEQAHNLVQSLSERIGSDRVAVATQQMSADGTADLTAAAVHTALTSGVAQTAAPLQTLHGSAAWERGAGADSPLQGAGLGALVGGAIGLATAASAVFVPGASALMITAGPAVSIAYGAMAGGLFGSVIDLSIAGGEGQAYIHDVERGDTLIVAAVDTSMQAEIEQLFHEFQATRVRVLPDPSTS